MSGCSCRRGRQDLETMVASAFGQAVVVGQDHPEDTLACQPQRGHEVDRVEGGDVGREDGLGLLERRLAHRHESDRAEKLVRVVEHAVAKRQTTQLDPKQPTCDVLIEVGQSGEYRRGVRFAEQDSTERAGVEVDAGHPLPRSVARCAALGEVGIRRAGRGARRGEVGGNLLQARHGHRRPELHSQARVAIGVLPGGNEQGDLVASLGDDQALPVLDPGQMAAEVLPELSNSDCLHVRHTVAHSGRLRREDGGLDAPEPWRAEFVHQTLMYADGMAARRTQIYLDDDLRARIERVRARDGRSMAEIIRAALDRYLGEDERVRRPLTEGPAPPWLGAWSGEGSPLPELREELARRAQRSAR